MYKRQIVDGVLYGADELVASWVKERLGSSGKVSEPFAALGICNRDETGLGAGLIFHSYQDGADVTLTVASEGPVARPRAIARCLSYAFDQLGLRRVSAEIELSNARSIRLAKGLGFVQEGVKRKAAKDGGHVAVMGLLRKDFRLKRYL